MKGKTTIQLKQLTASLLLVLFVFIHAVKLFHHHSEGASSNNHSSVIKVTVRSAFHCAVCDYQFIQDADHATAFALLRLPLIYPPAFIVHLISPTTSVGLSTGDRGPPAIV